jgi:aspartyl-tRNA(Asn)/glutamyl-tRNA(Gln) amidotransferase subunit C
MQVDAALISRLEKLARLQLPEAERARLAGDLTNILGLVEKLQELDTEGVEPLVYLSVQESPLRSDIIGYQLDTATALKNAPQQDGQYFRVPKVIE